MKAAPCPSLITLRPRSLFLAIPFNGDVSQWNTAACTNMKYPSPPFLPFCPNVLIRSCWLLVAVFPCLIPFLLSFLCGHVQGQCRPLSLPLHSAKAPLDVVG
eukprot:236357-Rhodomonas_salina.1